MILKKPEKVFRVLVAVKKKRKRSEKKRKNKNKRIFVDAYMNYNFTVINNLKIINFFIPNSAFFSFKSRFFTPVKL